MSRFAVGLHHWLQALRAPFEGVVPFNVECACGAVVAGNRKSTSQVRICPVCKQKVFILGRSPLPPVPGDPRSPTTRRVRLGPWLIVLGGTLVLLAIVAVGIVMVIGRAGGPPAPTPHEKLLAHQEAGITAWQDGHYAVAARELKAARKIREQLGEPTASEEARRFEQQEKQADLVANWLGKPLVDLLEKWNAYEDDDWQKLFPDQKGKAVAFDILLSRDGSGRYQYKRLLGLELPILGVKELAGLERLPLRQEQRLIFGVKLASLKRDRARPAGDAERWTVGFEPDSFVLITDEPIARALGLVIDSDMPSVLERQRSWQK